MRSVLSVACVLGLMVGATAVQAKPAADQPVVWRRSPSNFGQPAWIAAADLKKAQASKRKTKTVRVLTPGPMPQTAFNPAAAYAVATQTFGCDEASLTETSTYYDDAGAVIQTIASEKGWFPPGTPPVTIFKIVCQGDPVGGDLVELGSIAQVLAYPRPPSPPPHP